jgi:hypothetical protein
MDTLKCRKPMERKSAVLSIAHERFFMFEIPLFSNHSNHFWLSFRGSIAMLPPVHMELKESICHACYRNMEENSAVTI